MKICLCLALVLAVQIAFCDAEHCSSVSGCKVTSCTSPSVLTCTLETCICDVVTTTTPHPCRARDDCRQSHQHCHDQHGGHCVDGVCKCLQS